MVEPLALKPGDTFAEGFRVVQELGKSGDASALFAAEQVLTGRPCMLRVLHPRFVADAAGRTRFETACQLRASIESEHVVEVLAAGIDRERGTPWVALERLEGESLAARLARGPLAADDQEMALDIVGQLGAAWTAVRAADHSPGCLKPSKIFIATRRHHDGGLTVKLLDFWTDEVTRDPDASEAPEDVATLAWQAPELEGEDGDEGPASDVWSLGLLAFNLLVGKAYWKAFGSARPSAVSLVREISSEKHEVASVRAKALGFRRGLPPGFDDWFQQCLAHDPGERFSDPGEAVDALADILDPDADGEAEGDNDEEEDLAPPPPPHRTAGRKGAKASAWQAPWANSPNLAVPIGLAVALVLALGVRAVVLHQRAAHPGATTGAAGTAAPVPSVLVPGTQTPTELSPTARAAMVSALRASTGSPAWLATPANGAAAQRFADDLAQVFTEAGWVVHPISRINYRSDVVPTPGVRVYAADDPAPRVVETIDSAFRAAGIQAQVMTGYRAFYHERVLTQPGYQGAELEPDQTFVVLVQ